MGTLTETSVERFVLGARPMRGMVRFLVLLLIGLGLLTAIAYAAMTQITTGWFEKDLRLRSQLAVTSARQSLMDHWTADPQRLAASLADITHDERIMGAAACSKD